MCQDDCTYQGTREKVSIGGLQPSLEIQKDNGMAVLSSNMAATPLSFGSLGTGCKLPTVKICG